MNSELQDYLRSLDERLENKNVGAFLELRNVFSKIKSIEDNQTEASKFNFLDKSEYLVFSLFFDKTQLYQKNGSSLLLRRYKNEINEGLLSIENHREEVLKYWRERVQTVKSKALTLQYLSLIVKYSSDSSSVDLDEVKKLAETSVSFCSEGTSLNIKFILLTEYLNLALFFSEKKKETEDSFFSEAFNFVLGFIDSNKDEIVKDGWKYYWDMAIEFLFSNHRAPLFLPRSELERATKQFEDFAVKVVENFAFSLDSLKKIVERGKPTEALDLTRLKAVYANQHGFRFLVMGRQSVLNIRAVNTENRDLREQLREARRFFLSVFRTEFFISKGAVTVWFEEISKGLPQREEELSRSFDSSTGIESDVTWVARAFAITPKDVVVPEKFSKMPPFLMLINKYTFSFSHPEDFRNWVIWAFLIKTSTFLRKGLTDFKNKNKDPLAFYNLFLSEPIFDEWTKGPEEFNVLKKAIVSFWKNDFVLSYSLITSFFEEVLINIMQQEGGNWLTFYPPNNFRRDPLGTLLNDKFDVDITNRFFKHVTPEVVFHLKILLIQSAGFSLRNILSHGTIEKKLISPEDIANWFFQILCIYSFANKEIKK